MQLTSLTLHGFKSFGERTTIEFAPGVTAIVGPNGSGKSNVIDALRWATGGGRASEFRAGEKTDLIFHGASGKRSVGYAEVEIELRGASRSAKVNRNLARDGSTKLRLDGSVARLMDVDERLAGTGLGRGSLAVIGQGEVGQVLTADPAKLLAYVAEAAGIARLGARRDQAQDRLDTAKTHLQRLEDIMVGLDAQLGTLRTEAAQAERHNELTREGLQLRYTASLRRVESLSVEIEKLSAEQVSAGERLEQGRTELTALRERWQAARTTVGDLETGYREALTEAEVKRGDLRVAETRLQALVTRQEGVQREVATLEAELTRLKEASPPEKPEDDLDLLNAELAEQRRHFEQAREALSAVEAATSERQTTLEAARRAELEASEEQVRYRSRREQLEAQIATLNARLKASAAAEVDAETPEIQARVDELGAERQTLEARLAEALEALSAASQTHAQLEAEAQALERALERAQAAFEARRGYAQGPRLALSSGLPGVLGSVADLIRVPRRYRQAVASALGRRAEYVVVDTAQTAQAVIDFVKRSGGWVTVLPLELMRARQPSLPSAFENARGVIGLAADLVESEPEFERVVHQLLGGTVLAETMDAAVSLAKVQTRRPRLVTLDGGILEGYGAMTGGKSRVNPSVLGAAGEVEEAEAAASEASAAAKAAAENVITQQASARDLRAQLEERQSELAPLRQQLSEQLEARRLAASLRQELEGQLEQTASQFAALKAPTTRDVPDTQGYEAELALLRNQLAEQRSSAEAAAEQYRSLERRVLLTQERYAHFESELSRFEQEQARLTELEERRRDLERLRGATDHQLTEAKTAAEAARLALPQDLEQKAQAFGDAKTESARLEQALSDLTETQAATSETLEAVKVTLARREAALEIAQDDLAVFPEGLEALDLSNRACRDRLSHVERELEAIGLVNHRAAQELKEQQERFEDLEVQSVQAVQAVLELEAALTRIDQETTERLEGATTNMRVHFRDYVTQLFGPEAVGDITVHYEEERPVGMSIILQPSGKRTTSLNLLSVGERTMGAMAFLFSLMQGDGNSGLPLAILDEVDAPLDEANIRRYCGFVEMLAKRGTQFVLITHQKATFDIADVLWGVTSDRGVSRVFSISRASYAAAG